MLAPLAPTLPNPTEFHSNVTSCSPCTTRCYVKDSPWCKQWSLHFPTSSSGDPRRMRMRRNLPKHSTFCFNLSSSRSETASNSSGSGDCHHARKWKSASASCENSLTRLALMWFTLRLLMARDHLCQRLRRQRQHREHHVSLNFELSTNESLHSIQLSLVNGCAQ